MLWDGAVCRTVLHWGMLCCVVMYGDVLCHGVSRCVGCDVGCGVRWCDMKWYVVLGYGLLRCVLWCCVVLCCDVA